LFGINFEAAFLGVFTRGIRQPTLGFKFYATALPMEERAHGFLLPAKIDCIKLA
jgi:hypothetical protein